MAENAENKPPVDQPTTPLPTGQDGHAHQPDASRKTDGLADASAPPTDPNATLVAATWGDHTNVFRPPTSVQTPAWLKEVHFSNANDALVDINKAVWANADLKKQVKTSLDEAFGSVYGKDVVAVENKDLANLEALRQKELAQHKPGSQWMEGTTRCYIDEKGNLNKLEANGDFTFVGANSASVKRGEHQTFYRNNGEAIERLSADHYRYLSSDGCWEDISKDGIVKHLEHGAIQVPAELRMGLNDQYLHGIETGVIATNEGIGYASKDKHGDILVKLASRDGAIYLKKHGDSYDAYRIVDGKIYEYDRISKVQGKEVASLEELARRADGSFDFDTVHLTHNGDLTDKLGNVSFRNKSTFIEGDSYGHHWHSEITNNIMSLRSGDGSAGSEMNLLTGEYKEIGKTGKTSFTINLRSPEGLVLKADDVTFKPKETIITADGAHLTIRQDGSVSFDNSNVSWDNTATWQAQIDAAASLGQSAISNAISIGSAVYAKFSSNEGIDGSDIGALDSVIGQLDAAQAMCLRSCADQLAVSLSLVAGKLETLRAAAQGRIQLSSKLNNGGLSNTQVTQAMQQLGSGVTPGFIARQATHLS
jgi:hypothetical protein